MNRRKRKKRLAESRPLNRKHKNTRKEGMKPVSTAALLEL